MLRPEGEPTMDDQLARNLRAKQVANNAVNHPDAEVFIERVAGIEDKPGRKTMTIRVNLPC